jgi:hypothetical protein
MSKKSEETWKPFIDASLEKASRIIIKSINVRKNINNETSIDEVWFHKESQRVNRSRSSSRNRSVSRSRSRSGSRNMSHNRENYSNNRIIIINTHIDQQVDQIIITIIEVETIVD